MIEDKIYYSRTRDEYAFGFHNSHSGIEVLVKETKDEILETFKYICGKEYLDKITSVKDFDKTMLSAIKKDEEFFKLKDAQQAIVNLMFSHPHT